MKFMLCSKCCSINDDGNDIYCPQCGRTAEYFSFASSVDAEEYVKAWRDEDARAKQKTVKLSELARCVATTYDDMSFMRIRGNRALFAVQNDTGNGCHRELLSRAALNALLEV